MKIFNQIGIILGIWACGEIISSLIQNIIVIPGPIIGMIILFLLLQSKILKEEKIKDLSDFLLSNMGLFFIPAGVSLINSLGLIRDNALLLILCILLVNVVVMITSSKSVDFMISLKEKKEANLEEDVDLEEEVNLGEEV